jgi:glyoxylase-like metal-dependent hydrolase (beta-lactamase superfamily II)
MEQIEKGIYYEDTLPGVTLGAIVFPNGTVMIDSPLRSEDARSWRAMLLNIGSSTKRFLVNLDAHPDRTLGSRAMETTIVTHVNTAEELKFRPSVFKGNSLVSGAEWEINEQVIGTRWIHPVITFNEQMLFHLDDFQIILEHHSGPSTGAIWAIIPSAKVVFIGDTVVPGQPPFLAQADIPAWIESLNLLSKSYRNYIIVSGRGGPVPIETVRSQKTFLNKALKGLERLANRESPPEKTESLGKRLLKGFSIPPNRKTQYMNRLQHGLFHYYTRTYQIGKDNGSS